MSKWRTLAKVMRRMDQIGFTYLVQHPISAASKVAGYKRVILDIAVLDKRNNVIMAFYIGPRKQRRMLKYKMLKVPVYFFHDEEIDVTFNEMVIRYTEILLKLNAPIE